MSRCRAARATARYIAPVSKYSRPSARASARPTVDLPAPAGPSIAITSNVGLPAGALRAAFVVARGTLHADDGALVELGDAARTGVGARAAHPGDDLVEDVLHAGTIRI